MLIDSHSHLDMDAFDRDRKQVLERAKQGCLTHIVTIGIDLPSSRKALQLAHEYDFIFSTIGFHPHHADEMNTQALEDLSGLAAESKVVAWGEIGLDFFHRHCPPDTQKKAFGQQLKMAMDFDLPVIIHARDAHEDMLEILRKARGKGHKGVVHCFSGGYELAMTLIEMGFYISIPGIVTYKNAVQIKDVASRIPLEHMLLETDAPYLAPVPKRGKRNEPAFVSYTAKKVAQLRNTTFEEVSDQTSKNAKRLFSLPDKP